MSQYNTKYTKTSYFALAMLMVIKLDAIDAEKNVVQNFFNNHKRAIINVGALFTGIVIGAVYVYASKKNMPDNAITTPTVEMLNPYEDLTVLRKDDEPFFKTNVLNDLKDLGLNSKASFLNAFYMAKDWLIKHDTVNKKPASEEKTAVIASLEKNLQNYI